MDIRRYWLRNAVWENHTKDRIKATLETVEDNKTTRQQMVVSRFDNQGRSNKDYEDIINHVTSERIDANTVRVQQELAAKQRKEAQAKKDAENTRRLEQLFQLKIDAFEIPEVKESSDRVLKSKLRKSKNSLEVQVYASVIAMNHYLQSQNVVEEPAATVETVAVEEPAAVVEHSANNEDPVVNSDEQTS